MKVEKIVLSFSKKYLNCISKKYLDKPEKAFHCLGYHLYQAALKASVLNQKFSCIIDEIIEKFDAPYECPERLVDTDSCEYSRLLNTYASKVTKEIEKDWQDGNN